MKPIIFRSNTSAKSFYVLFDRPCDKMADYWYITSSPIFGHNVMFGTKVYNSKMFLKENPDFSEYTTDKNFDELKIICLEILTLRGTVQLKKLKNI